MPVRSAVLGAATLVAGNIFTFGTVPAGQTWIVKFATFAALSPVDASVSLWWKRTVPNTTGVIFVANLPVAVPFDTFSGWMVGLPGDQLQAFPSGSNVWCWISGTKLSGVAT
jgi:hypothetical protein